MQSDETMLQAKVTTSNTYK